jgi:hypothetical protein
MYSCPTLGEVAEKFQKSLMEEDPMSASSRNPRAGAKRPSHDLLKPLNLKQNLMQFEIYKTRNLETCDFESARKTFYQ